MGANAAANALGPVVRGRRGLFGYTVGILVLETTIPRLPGAIGNASTFPFPVLQRVVPGASGEATVRALGRCRRGTPEFAAAIAPWLQAARDIVAEGAKAVTTSCGFTALFQRELTEAVDAPVFASSLLLAPLIQRMLRPEQVVGAIVADSRSMTNAHLEGAGIVPGSIAVRGLEGYPVFEAFAFKDEPDLDVGALRAELLDAVGRLKREEARLGAVLLECSLFPPFAHDVQAATGLPVFDFTHLVHLVHDSLARKPFQGIL